MAKEFMSSKLKFNDGVRKVVRADLTMDVGDGYLDITDAIKEVVKCEQCGKLHDNKDAEEVKFITIFGNVHANNAGGLLGSGEWDNYGVPVHHFCPGCLIESVKKWVKKGY